MIFQISSEGVDSSKKVSSVSCRCFSSQLCYSVPCVEIISCARKLVWINLESCLFFIKVLLSAHFVAWFTKL